MDRSNLEAFAMAVIEHGGDWLSVRERPFRNEALLRVWLPSDDTADLVMVLMPSHWRPTRSGHLRRAGDVSYHGVQIAASIPLDEVVSVRGAARAAVASGGARTLGAGQPPALGSGLA